MDDPLVFQSERDIFDQPSPMPDSAFMIHYEKEVSIFKEKPLKLQLNNEDD